MTVPLYQGYTVKESLLILVTGPPQVDFLIFHQLSVSKSCKNLEVKIPYKKALINFLLLASLLWFLVVIIQVLDVILRISDVDPSADSFPCSLLRY